MTRWEAREHHRFESAGQPFVYLVPSAGVFALDQPADAVFTALTGAPATRDELAARLSGRLDPAVLDETLAELARVRAIGETERPMAASRTGAPDRAPAAMPKVIPLTAFPLSTMVLNVTNQCNLSCAYCYEYGEDKIVDTENGKKPKFMSEDTARQSVDFMLRAAGDSPVAHLTFFGGETLLNFPVLKKTIAYARQRASDVGKDVDFSLTTNATLLKPEIIEFLAEERVGVTISIDGPRDVQDKFRVFHNGAGSYDLIEPKVRELLARHKTRPIGARVTLTSAGLDVARIFRHLRDDIGFWEVGFAPVTTSPAREHAITVDGYDVMLEQFRDLAYQFRDCAIANRHHGFSNVKETVEEIHKGMSKAYPCGAGLGLLGVATDGDVALCHRFAGSDTHKLGTVRDGIDHRARQAFLESHHIDRKTDCHTCWARPHCAGGCYHEAHVRYGDTQRPNLHYCEWIRGWTDVCLRIYGEIALRNPGYFRQLSEGAGAAARTS